MFSAATILEIKTGNLFINVWKLLRDFLLAKISI